MVFNEPIRCFTPPKRITETVCSLVGFGSIARQIGHCMGVTLRIRYWVWSTFDLGKAKGIQLKDSTHMLSVRMKIRVCLVYWIGQNR